MTAAAHRVPRLACGAAALAVILAACGSTAPRGAATPATVPASTAPAPPAAATAPASTAVPPQWRSLSATLRGYDPAGNPEAYLEAGLAKARQSHRELLIDFGANWCVDCRILDALFRGQAVRPLLARDYLLMAVDIGHANRNLGFAARYVKLLTSGLPALAVLSPDGKIRYASNDGAFANARRMDAAQVRAFLIRWAL